MDGEDLGKRVDALVAEGNYIGAYSKARSLPDSDGLRAELTGRIANAIVQDLQSARSQGSERQAYLRAQLAWVCRDIPGLSYLYREQLRMRQPDLGGDILKSIQDIAAGRPRDAADRVRRGVEDVQESIASGEAADKVQGFLKDAERAVRDGAKQVGSFLDSIVKRGEAVRLEREARPRARPPEGTDAETPADGGARIPIDTEDEKGQEEEGRDGPEGPSS